MTDVKQPVMVRVVKHLTCVRCKVKSQTIKSIDEAMFDAMREQDPKNYYLNDKTSIERQVNEDYTCMHCK